MRVIKPNSIPSLSRIALLSSLVLLLLFAGAAQGAELKSRSARFGDTKVHYLTGGKGNDALIFVHGWTCDAHFWSGQTSAFPSLRVIALDLPGHGQSDKPQVEYTMEYFARSIEAVMRDAKIKRAVLVGHSMGTPIIRQFYRLYPDKTLGLVIVDGALRLLFPKAQMEQFTAQLRTNYKIAEPMMVDGMLSVIKDAKLKADIRKTMVSTPDYVGISAMDGMADQKIYTTDPIKVPVLAVMAEGPFWPPDTEQFMRSLAPSLEFHMWKGVSHFLMMEKPQELNQVLQAFLTKNRLLTK